MLSQIWVLLFLSSLISPRQDLSDDQIWIICRKPRCYQILNRPFGLHLAISRVIPVRILTNIYGGLCQVSDNVIKSFVTISWQCVTNARDKIVTWVWPPPGVCSNLISSPPFKTERRSLEPWTTPELRRWDSNCSSWVSLIAVSPLVC